MKCLEPHTQPGSIATWSPRAQPDRPALREQCPQVGWWAEVNVQKRRFPDAQPAEMLPRSHSETELSKN